MLAREQKYRSKPEVRERINRQRQLRNLRDPGKRAKKAERARRYKERHPERVRDQQKRANDKRSASGARAEYSRLYERKYPPGTWPKCRTCGGDVEWNEVGRPRLDCRKCRP